MTIDDNESYADTQHNWRAGHDPEPCRDQPTTYWPSMDRLLAKNARHAELRAAYDAALAASPTREQRTSAERAYRQGVREIS